MSIELDIEKVHAWLNTTELSDYKIGQETDISRTLIGGYRKDVNKLYNANVQTIIKLKNLMNKLAEDIIYESEDFKAGYEKAKEEELKRDRKLISTHPYVFEEQHYLTRVEFREVAQRRVRKTISKDFLDFIDTKLFRLTTKQPKRDIFYLKLGDWIYTEGRYLFRLSEIQDDEYTLEYAVQYALLDTLLHEFNKKSDKR